ncbi:methyltransferase-like protein 27 [Oculina patagonica]
MALWDTTYDKFLGQKVSQLTKETTEDEIKELYKNWATNYDKNILQESQIVYRKPLAESLDAAIKKVFQDGTRSQIKIIDAGAGTGLAGVELSKLGYTNIDALDISLEMLDEAKKKNVYSKFICAPLTEQRNPEIDTGEYHALISAGVLVIGHVRPDALDEMIRMVKKGGLFCFSMRELDVKEYEEKMLELEKTEKWKMLSKEKIPYSDNDNLPKEIIAFIFKVLNN